MLLPLLLLLVLLGEGFSQIFLQNKRRKVVRRWTECRSMAITNRYMVKPYQDKTPNPNLYPHRMQTILTFNPDPTFT